MDYKSSSEITKRCDEIDKRIAKASSRMKLASIAVVGWSFTAVAMAAMMVMAGIRAEAHYAHEDKINQEIISWKNK